MQHDVCPNPVRLQRKAFPFIVVLQSDMAESDERLCAPLYLVGRDAGPAPRSMPLIDFDGGQYRLFLGQIASLPKPFLRHPVGTVASYRDEILSGLDWLFTGL